MDTFGTVRLEPGNEEIHAFPNNSSSSSLLIKALAGNEKEVEIAESEEKLEESEGYPLEKGEKVSLEIKGTKQFFYKCNASEDGLVLLFLSP